MYISTDVLKTCMDWRLLKTSLPISIFLGFYDPPSPLSKYIGMLLVFSNGNMLAKIALFNPLHPYKCLHNI